MGLRLLFLTNFPGATFIQGATFIPDSRVHNLMSKTRFSLFLKFYYNLNKYTAGINIWCGSFLTVNHKKHKIESHPFYQFVTDFHGDEAIFFFLKKKFKMAESKKLRF